MLTEVIANKIAMTMIITTNKSGRCDKASKARTYFVNIVAVNIASVDSHGTLHGHTTSIAYSLYSISL